MYICCAFSVLLTAGGWFGMVCVAYIEPTFAHVHTCPHRCTITVRASTLLICLSVQDAWGVKRKTQQNIQPLIDTHR